MRLIPYEPKHLYQMKVQDEQQYVIGQMEDIDEYAKLLCSGIAFTGYDDDTDTVVGCAGLIPIHHKLSHAWALFSDIRKFKRPVFVETKRMVDFVLDEEHSKNRIQMTVAEHHKEGELFAIHLGFKKDCLMEQYGVEGENHWLYSRVSKLDPKYTDKRTVE